MIYDIWYMTYDLGYMIFDIWYMICNMYMGYVFFYIIHDIWYIIHENDTPYHSIDHYRRICHSLTYFAYNAIQQQQTCHVKLYLLHAIPQSTTSNGVPHHAIADSPIQLIRFLTIPYYCRSYHAIPLHNIAYLDFSLHTISNWRDVRWPDTKR